MEILEIDEGNIPQLVALIKEIHSENPNAMTFEGKPSGQYLIGMLRTKIELARRRSAVDLVALENGNVLGECEIINVNGEGRVGILVSRMRRRNGIGRLLLDAALKQAGRSGIMAVYAEVDNENLAAVLFFGKYGFEFVGEKLSVNGRNLRRFRRLL